MKKFLMFLCALTLVFGMAGTASAVSFTNGSFETGNFDGWMEITLPNYGSASVVTNDSGFIATDGTYFASLTGLAGIGQFQSWAAGETFSFDWNFNANDKMPYNDSSLLLVLGTGTGTGVFDFITLADVESVGDYIATDWQTYTHTFASAGSGAIGFGVYNALDTLNDSQLYIDNVGGPNGNGTNPVPEPSTILLIGVGLIGLAGYSRKRFSKKS